MGEYGRPGFTHLNRGNQWPGFERRGLDLGTDGVLRLYRVPRLDGAVPPSIAAAPAPARGGGIVATADGTVLFTEPDRDRVMSRDGCAGRLAPLSCVAGPLIGGGLSAPGALALIDTRTVALADTGHARLLFIDLSGPRVVESWPDITAGALAGDGHGLLWVADPDGGRVRCIDRRGGERSSVVVPGVDRILALAVHDGTLAGLAVASGTGQAVLVTLAPGAPPHTRAIPNVAQAMGLAMTADAFYVGDNGARTVLKVSRRSDGLVAAAAGFHGPVQALAIDGQGGLWVHACSGEAPLRLAIDAGAVRSGVLWGRVTRPTPAAVTWHRLRAAVAVPDGSHVQLFVAAAGMPVHPDAIQPFGDRWSAKGVDVTDVFVGVGKTESFWLGLHLFSDGASTPELSQVHVNYDQPTYLSWLPPLFSETDDCGGFLLRYLSLFESVAAESEARIQALPSWFDVEAARTEGLDWLGSWLAMDLDERWSDRTRRDVIRAAFGWYGRRGTLEGLREALLLFAGTPAVIEEAAASASWWSHHASPRCDADAADAPTLGAGTTLASVEPDGAVLGSSAVLDRSFLLHGDEYGRPLFEAFVHQICVRVPWRAARDEAARERIRAVLERECPAHVAYTIDVIEPSMRIGLQSRLGVDSVVAGRGAPAGLGESAAGFELGGEPAAPVGIGLRVGISTRA